MSLRWGVEGSGGRRERGGERRAGGREEKPGGRRPPGPPPLPSPPHPSSHSSSARPPDALSERQAPCAPPQPPSGARNVARPQPGGRSPAADDAAASRWSPPGHASLGRGRAPATPAQREPPTQRRRGRARTPDSLAASAAWGWRRKMADQTRRHHEHHHHHSPAKRARDHPPQHHEGTPKDRLRWEGALEGSTTGAMARASARALFLFSLSGSAPGPPHEAGAPCLHLGTGAPSSPARSPPAAGPREGAHTPMAVDQVMLRQT